jgi:hypothetical protein
LGGERERKRRDKGECSDERGRATKYHRNLRTGELHARKFIPQSGWVNRGGRRRTPATGHRRGTVVLVRGRGSFSE